MKFGEDAHDFYSKICLVLLPLKPFFYILEP